MSLFSKFKSGTAKPIFRRNKHGEVKARFGKRAVGDSDDLRRILALPRRKKPDTKALAAEWTLKLQRGDVACNCAQLRPDMGCITELNEIQGWYLSEAATVGGVIGPIGVGSGKTALGILLAMVVPDCKVAVLLVPPNLKKQFEYDFECWSQHFKTPNLAGGKGTFTPGRPVLHVLAYSELSHESCSAWLSTIKPDLIIADEVQCLKDLNSVRTDRFIRYFQSAPDTKFFCHSGSLSTRSINDYCLDPATRVLTSDLRWVRAEDVKPDDELIGFDENLGRCKLQRTNVRAVAGLTQPKYRVTTDRGVVVCSATHKWVQCSRNGVRSKRKWTETHSLLEGDEIAFFVEPWEFDASREGGYLAGLLDGEGWLCEKGKVGFGQLAGAVLDRYRAGLTRLGIKFTTQPHKSGVFRVLPNGEAPSVRLLGMLMPSRLMQKATRTWEGKAPWGKNTRPARVTKIEYLGEGHVIAIETGTHTLIAEGFLTHNCHLAGVALGEASPLPLHPGAVAEWSSAVDPQPGDGIRAPAGALKSLCGPGEDVLEGFSRRLLETPGVVATEESTLGLPPLVMTERKVKAVPEAVRNALAHTRALQQRPDGEELVQATEVAAVCRQLACGFFYRWKFPRGEPVELIEEWFQVRQNWNRELRERLKYRVEGMDSPLLCKRAAERWFGGYTWTDNAGKVQSIAPKTRRGPLPVWESTFFLPWLEIENRVYHETEAVWLSDFLAQDAADWATKNKGIVWYEHGAFGGKVAEISGLPLYGGGDEASEGIIAEDGKRSIIASVKAHGTGKNLQKFRRNLVAQPPSDGGAWEQLIGRTHRQGQKADEVSVAVYRHTDEMVDALDKATSYARYVQSTLKNIQKLCYVRRDWSAPGAARRGK